MAKMEKFFKFMLDQKASDIHLRTNMKPLIRIHGDLIPINYRELTSEEIEGMVTEIMDEETRGVYARTHDADWAYGLPGVARFRCNAFFDYRGCGAVFRMIPLDLLTAEELGLSREAQALCMNSNGLVLVTGPTGCGKTTTLATMIDIVNRSRRDHIITIEDPIEYIHTDKKCLVNQRQFRHHTKSFKRALREALREDPDIVLVGEMRDLETIALAIETAETGHLVFGTLHTNTAANTVDRIVDQFPPARQEQIRLMLSTTLRAVISQQLVKRADGKGRVAVFEQLFVTTNISHLISESNTHMIPGAMQIGKRHGMTLLNDELLKLVQKGVVKADDAYMKSPNQLDFLKLLIENGIEYRPPIAL